MIYFLFLFKNNQKYKLCGSRSSWDSNSDSLICKLVTALQYFSLLFTIPCILGRWMPVLYNFKKDVWLIWIMYMIVNSLIFHLLRIVSVEIAHLFYRTDKWVHCRLQFSYNDVTRTSSIYSSGIFVSYLPNYLLCYLCHKR